VTLFLSHPGRRRLAVAATLGALVLALAALSPARAGAAASTSGTIAFESNRTGNFDIFTMAATGGGQAQLTSDPADDLDPAWSPDGRRIAFASRRGNDLNIWVMNADGTGQVALTSGPGSDRYPTWAPDGARIAFRRDTGAQSDIWVVGTNGVAAPLTTGALADQPAWSPDGTRIAFVSTRDANDEVYVMSTDGTGQRNLSANPASDRSPHWSSDSARIIFRSLRLPAEGRELFVMAPDGGAQAAFASSPGADRTPSFAPDGSGAVFATGRFGNQDIASIGIDGSGLRQLTIDPASDDEPVWTAASTAAATAAPGGAGAAGATVARDLVAPKLTVRIARRQHLRRAIRLVARCSEGCTLRVSASVRTRGRKGAPRSRVYIRKLVSGRPTVVRVKLSRGRLAIIRRSLRRGSRVQATVTAFAADGAGNLAPRVRRGTRLLR
jgi:dipeptidyl aminopeptidase/acylaminoacyl peptidase